MSSPPTNRFREASPTCYPKASSMRTERRAPTSRWPASPRASDTTTYQLNPPDNVPYSVLPPVLAGGYTTAPFPTAASAMLLRERSRDGRLCPTSPPAAPASVMEPWTRASRMQRLCLPVRSRSLLPLIPTTPTTTAPCIASTRCGSNWIATWRTPPRRIPRDARTTCSLMSKPRLEPDPTV